ncbi:MAG: hypothetical protein J6K19_04140 [Prevotella sp.]|nr:hypothetical protein [Prevotella sp.]
MKNEEFAAAMKLNREYKGTNKDITPYGLISAKSEIIEPRLSKRTAAANSSFFTLHSSFNKVPRETNRLNIY